MDDTLLFGNGIWNVKIWIGLGFVFLILSALDSTEVRSPFWFSEIILYSLMIFGLWANSKYRLRKKIVLSRKLAALAYIGLVWLFGMVFETSLTVTGEGIGGVHPKTLPSFILAQGDYILIAIVSYLAIRLLRLSFREVFFLSGGKSLTEGLIFTGVLTAIIASPMFILTPFVVAYYTLAYSSFMALPLLFIDEELLWRDQEPTLKRSITFIWVLGFGLALAIRLFWGLAYSPAVTWLFRLPPNVVGN